MADEIRKIANLRTEASAPDLPGRVQNEEFVFDEMIGAELVQEVCRHKDIRSVEKLFSLADPIMISGAGDSQKALLTAMAAKGDSPSIIIVPSQKDVFRWEMDLRFLQTQKTETRNPYVAMRSLQKYPLLIQNA